MKTILGFFILVSFNGIANANIPGGNSYAVAPKSEKSELKFLSEVYVDHDQIVLADLIDESSKVPAALEKIVIAETPKNGEVSKFSSYAISEILRYNLKNDVHNYTFKIPTEIRVSRKNNKITATEIKSKLTDWVRPSCEPCDVQIEALQIQNNGEIPQTLRWELPTTQILPKGNFTAAVDLYNNDNFVKKIYVSGVLRIYKSVPVAKRPLPAGTKVQKEDYVFKKQDMTFAHDVAPIENEIAGSETSQMILPNQPLWKSDLKRKFAMTRGAPVQVTLENDGWSIHFSGIAQDNGYVGDIAKVLNPQTKKVVTGIVTDENMVEVK